MKRLSFLGPMALAIAVGLVYMPERVATQATTLVFGSYSGAAKAIAVDSSGYMGVSVGAGAITNYAGTGAGTFTPTGLLCSTLKGTCGCTAATDASVQNQWNVITCTIPASVLTARPQLVPM